MQKKNGGSNIDVESPSGSSEPNGVSNSSPGVVRTISHIYGESLFEGYPAINLMHDAEEVEPPDSSYLNAKHSLFESRRLDGLRESVTHEAEDLEGANTHRGAEMPTLNVMGLETSLPASSYIKTCTDAVAVLSEDGHLFGLNDSVPEAVLRRRTIVSGSLDTFMKPVRITDPFGQEIVIHSASFVLAYAAHKVLPHKSLGVRHGYCLEETPLTCGLYIDVVDDQPLHDAEFRLIQSAFYKVIQDDIPITCVTLQEDDVLDRLRAQGSNIAYTLLRSRNIASSYECYEIDNYITLRRRPLTPTSSLLQFGRRVELFKEQRGMVLRLKGWRPIPRSPGLDATFDRAIKWGNTTQTDCMGDINEKVLRDPENLIRLEETRFDNEVMYCAMSALRDRPELKIVLISGPSASGKTTFASKLALAFKSLGREPIVMSTDDYYRDIRESDYPTLPNGQKNCESVEAIRLSLLREHLKELLLGHPIIAPIFDMVTSRPKEKGVPLQLGKSGVVIMEGIFTLAQVVTEGIDRSGIFSIFISPMPFFFLDEQSFIQNSVVRLIRRIVRDYLHRGRDATASISRLRSVSRGEVEVILPYISQANYFFNSAMAHELPVLRTLAIPLLRKVVASSEVYPHAQQLLKVLNYVTSCSDCYLQNTSLLREFIGGSIFEHKKLEIASEQRPVMDARANMYWGVRLCPTNGEPITVKEALRRSLVPLPPEQREGFEESNLLAIVLNGELVPLSHPITVYDDQAEQMEVATGEHVVSSPSLDEPENTPRSDAPEGFSTGLFAKPIVVGGPRSSEVMRATVTFLLHVAVRKLWPTRHIIVSHGFGSEGSNHYSGCSYFVKVYDSRDRRGKRVELCHDNELAVLQTSKELKTQIWKKMSGQSISSGLNNLTVSTDSFFNPWGRVVNRLEDGGPNAISPPGQTLEEWESGSPLQGHTQQTQSIVKHNENAVALTDQDLVAMTAKMNELIDKKAELVIKRISGPSAVQYFKNANMTFTTSLLRSRNLPTVEVISCECEMALYFHPVAPHCGFVDKNRFALYPYADGLALVFDYAEGFPHYDYGRDVLSETEGHSMRAAEAKMACGLSESGAPCGLPQSGDASPTATMVAGHRTGINVEYVTGNLPMPGGPMSPVSAVLTQFEMNPDDEHLCLTGMTSEHSSRPPSVNEMSGSVTSRYCHIEPYVESNPGNGALRGASPLIAPADPTAVSLDDVANFKRTTQDILVINGNRLNMKYAIYRKAIRNKRLLPPIVSRARLEIQENTDNIRCATKIGCLGDMNHAVMNGECMTVAQVSNATFQRRMNKIVAFIKAELCKRTLSCAQEMKAPADTCSICPTVSGLLTAGTTSRSAESKSGNTQDTSPVSPLTEADGTFDVESGVRNSEESEDDEARNCELGGLVILIAGPSSSGKTILTEKLTVHLNAAGIKTRTLSMDNYYKDLGKDNYPRTPNGDWDCESVHALRLNDLERDVLAIMSGQDVETPIFDLGRGCRRTDQTISVKGMTNNAVLICEGVFALNELVLPSIPPKMRMRIVVYPTSMLNIDELRFVSHRVLRITRRIVRDYMCRNRDARETLHRWNAVNEGEDRNILPFIDKVDVLFNASTLYEMGALKSSLLPLLEQVSPLFPEEYERAVQLRKLLTWYYDIPDTRLPQSESVRHIMFGNEQQ